MQMAKISEIGRAAVCIKLAAKTELTDNEINYLLDLVHKEWKQWRSQHEKKH